MRSNFGSIASPNLTPWAADERLSPGQNTPGAGGLQIANGTQPAAASASWKSTALPSSTSGTKPKEISADVREPHRYAYPHRGMAMVTSNGTLFLPETDARRNFLILRNLDPTYTIAIGFGVNADANSVIQLPAGSGPIGFDISVPQNDLWAMAIDPTAAAIPIIDGPTLNFSAVQIGIIIPPVFRARLAWEVSTITFSQK